MKIDERDRVLLSAIGEYNEPNHVTDAELADRMNISRSTFYKRIKNPGDMKLKEFRRLAKLAGFSDAKILGSIKS